MTNRDISIVKIECLGKEIEVGTDVYDVIRFFYEDGSQIECPTHFLNKAIYDYLKSMEEKYTIIECNLKK